MSESMPRCLAIGGLDPSGGAGIVADVRTLTAFECRSSAVVTSVTFQNDRQVLGVEHMSAGSIRRQIEAVLAGADVDAVKTGMLPTADIVRTVAEIIRGHGLSNIVVDTVLNSTSGYKLVNDEAAAAMVEYLFPIAMLVTPNILELEFLTRLSISTPADVQNAANRLRAMGARNVLVKGGHLPGQKGEVIDFLFEANSTQTIRHIYVPNVSVRGTGCMLASAAAAGLADGCKLSEAVLNAVSYVHKIIASSKDP